MRFFIFTSLVLVVLFGCKKEEPNTPPVASFTATPESGDADTIFTFDASGCTDKEDTVEELQVRWDFETDGTWDTQYSTVKTVIHQFTVSGTYTISLEVKNSIDLTSSISKQLKVEYVNHPPVVPSSPAPYNYSTDQNTIITLHWECLDPDGDPLVYDIYFGGNDDLSLVGKNVTNNHYDITDLDTETIYSWKIVVRDDKGEVTEGPIWKFKTSSIGIFNDSRDDNTYNWVRIGSQVWMAENLSWLPSVSDHVERWGSGPYYYVYDYIGTNVSAAKATDNYEIYGVLYNWEAAKIACPEGWHLPNINEWLELFTYLGRYLIAGGEMKETGTEHWLSPNTGATNSSGFNALPGGSLDEDGFIDLRKSAFFWNSTDSYPENCCARSTGLYHNLSVVYDNNHNKKYGLSVRCLRD